MKEHYNYLSSSQIHPMLQKAWQHCEEVRRELLATLSKVERSEWLRRLKENAWTIAEFVDHLNRSEIGTSKMVRAMIKGSYNNIKRPADLILYTVALDVYPYGPLPAPRLLVPKMDFNINQAYDVLADTHERFYKELTAFSGLDPEILESPDPDTGYWFTLGGWVRLQSLHEAHHLSQINDLIAAM